MNDEMNFCLYFGFIEEREELDLSYPDTGVLEDVEEEVIVDLSEK